MPPQRRKRAAGKRRRARPAASSKKRPKRGERYPALTPDYVEWMLGQVEAVRDQDSLMTYLYIFMPSTVMSLDRLWRLKPLYVPWERLTPPLDDLAKQQILVFLIMDAKGNKPGAKTRIEINDIPPDLAESLTKFVADHPSYSFRQLEMKA